MERALTRVFQDSSRSAPTPYAAAFTPGAPTPAPFGVTQTPGVYDYQTPAPTGYPQTPAVMGGSGYGGTESPFGEDTSLVPVIIPG